MEQSKKHKDSLDMVNLFAKYIDQEKKVIAIVNTIDNYKKANNSSSLKHLTTKEKYKVRFVKEL